jgi:hypothetical protein
VLGFAFFMANLQWPLWARDPPNAGGASSHDGRTMCGWTYRKGKAGNRRFSSAMWAPAHIAKWRPAGSTRYPTKQSETAPQVATSVFALQALSLDALADSFNARSCAYCSPV